MSKEQEIKKATVTKKTVKRKTETKKVDAKEVDKKPTIRAKRVEIDQNALIPCRSTTHGNLIYISRRTGERIFWNDFGDVQDITMGELRNLYSTYPAFINEVLFVIDDEDAVEYLGLTKLYNSLFYIDDLDSFFDRDYDELEEILPKLPKGLEESVATKARELIKEGTLDSRSKIRLIEDKLKIDLTIFDEK